MIAKAVALSITLAGMQGAWGQPCHSYWSAVGIPTDFASSPVVFNDGGGPRLYALHVPGSMSPVVAARWDGVSWEPLLNGWANPAQVRQAWHAVFVMPGASTPSLYQVLLLQTGPVSSEYRGYFWTGAGWVVAPSWLLDSGWFVNLSGQLYSVRRCPPGTASVLCVCRYEGGDWVRVGPKFTTLTSLTVVNLGAGPRLCATGSMPFDLSTEGTVTLIEPSGAWTTLPNASVSIRTALMFDDGTGPALYVGGSAVLSATNPLPSSLRRWNAVAQAWEDPGGGLGSVGLSNQVRVMTVFDDGSGPAIFAGGYIQTAPGVSGFLRGLAKWDGVQWSRLGIGLSGPPHPDGMAVFDDGRGESLFIAGEFLQAGGGSVTGFAQWVGCNGQCYPDCDNNQQLEVADFSCFLAKFIARDPYADCDLSTQAPYINVADFSCFLRKYAQGCGR